MAEDLKRTMREKVRRGERTVALADVVKACEVPQERAVPQLTWSILCATNRAQPSSIDEYTATTQS